VPADGDHRSGRIVRAGAPVNLVHEFEGRVWRKTIDTRDLDAMRRDHDVITTRLFGGRTIVHVLAQETPGARFGPAPAVLEDVYFSTLPAVRRAASGAAAVFSKTASFEFRYQVRSALFWVTVLIFAVLAFGSIASDNVRIGGISGVRVQRGDPRR
jgi:hypothetical protein